MLNHDAVDRPQLEPTDPEGPVVCWPQEGRELLWKRTLFTNRHHTRVIQKKEMFDILQMEGTTGTNTLSSPQSYLPWHYLWEL